MSPDGPPPAWGGRPVARRLGDVAARRRVEVSGRVARTGLQVVGTAPSLCVEVDDGTGSIECLFLGRRVVPGVVPGALVSVAATAVERGGRLVLLNPALGLAGPGGRPPLDRGDRL